MIFRLVELKERRSKRIQRSFDKSKGRGDTSIGQIKGNEIKRNKNCSIRLMFPDQAINVDGDLIEEAMMVKP